MNIDIPKNYCLINSIDDTDELQSGEFKSKIGRTPDGIKYSEGEFSVRRGHLIHLPNRIDYSEQGTPWKNYVRPIVGNIVYFDYLTAKGADIYQGCLIMPFRSLILHLNPDMDTNSIEMLNGYLLAHPLPRTSSNLDIKSVYEDRFKIKKAGELNLGYLDGSVDDKAIVEGSNVITRFNNICKLEADFQLRLDGSSYVYMQRKDCIGIL